MNIWSRWRAFSPIAVAFAAAFAASPAAFAAQSGDIAAAIAWGKQELGAPVARTPGLKGEELLRFQEQQRIGRYLGSCERGSQNSCNGLVLMHKDALALENAKASVTEESLAQKARSACGAKTTEPECLVLTHLGKVCAAGDQPTCDRLNALKAAASGPAGGQPPAGAPPAQLKKAEDPLERWRRIQEERYKQAAAYTEQAARNTSAPTAAAPAEPAAPAPDKSAKVDAKVGAEVTPMQPAPPAAAAKHSERAVALAWARKEIATPMAQPTADPADFEAFKKKYQKWTRQQALVKHVALCDEGSATGCAVVTKLYQDAVAAGEVPAPGFATKAEP